LKTFNYNQFDYQLQADETVLDCLLRNNVDVPYACKAGVCHVCMMQCTKGDVGIEATDGLSISQIENGHFLSCQCSPENNLKVKEIDESGLYSQALVVDKTLVTDTVCSLKLKTATQIYYRAGQFINIKMSNKHVRSYSIASLPTEDDFLELHVKKMDNGLLSSWIYDDIKNADVINIQGPFGDCYYPTNHTSYNILMIATGTGIAPILGILKDALSHGHQGQINIYHGDKQQSDLYSHPLLIAFEKQNKNVHYYPATSVEDQSHNNFYHGRAADLAFSNHVDLSDHLVYLCGSPEMVDIAKSRALARGADAKMIHADPFVTKDLRSNDR